MRAQYRLAKQTSTGSAYAEVTLDASTPSSGGREVHLSPDVFAWLKQAYGPGAWEWPACDAYRQAARDGVLFALENAAPPAPEHASVRVEEIHVHPAHSTARHVTFAAAHATWQALGLQPTRVPPLA